MDYTEVQKRFEVLTTAELKEIKDLINKGENVDAWIKLNMSPKDFEAEKAQRERSSYINEILQKLLE